MHAVGSLSLLSAHNASSCLCRRRVRPVPRPPSVRSGGKQVCRASRRPTRDSTVRVSSEGKVLVSDKSTEERSLEGAERGHEGARRETGVQAQEPPRPTRVSADVVRGIMRGFQSMRDEMDFWVPEAMVTEGRVPVDLSGTVFRNGPGLFEYGDNRINQMFDGDGMITRLVFRGGRVHFKNRYVRTNDFVAEQSAGRFLRKSVFSTGNPSGGVLFNPFDFHFKNPANTAAVVWAGQLLALNEAGLPAVLDPRTLETLRCDVRSLDPTDHARADIRTDYFHAHHRVLWSDAGSKRLVGLGSSMAGINGLEVEFYEFGPSGHLLHRNKEFLPGANLGFFHDFVVTENYYVLVQNPTELDMRALLTEYVVGKRSMAECIAFRKDKKARLHVIPRPGAHPACRRQTLDLETFFVFHFLNAFEAPGGPSSAPSRLVVDLIPLPEIKFTSHEDAISEAFYANARNRSEVHRVVADLGTGVARSARVTDAACEMPTVAGARAGRPHSVGFAQASRVRGSPHFGPSQGVSRFAFPEPLRAPLQPRVAEDFWDAGEDRIVTEPLFVPRDGAQWDTEDDGYLVASMYNWRKDRTEVAILDARRPSAGPVAIVELPFVVPYGLHGSWDAQDYGPEGRPDDGGVRVLSHIQ